MKSTKIISFGRSVPSPQIDHAGGQYVNTLLTELARHASVHVFAPSEPGNDAAAATGAPFGATELGARQGTTARDRLGRLVDLLACRAMPIVPAPTFRLALARSTTARAQVRDADVLDVQWTDYAALLPWLRRHARRDARVVCTMHDVISEKWERRASADGNVVMRLRATLVARVARRLERLAIANCDRIVVFSEKDRDLVLTRHADADPGAVVVVDPPLGAATLVAPRTEVDPDEVLFIGAMARPENHASAMWFLKDIWPHILSERPTARLTIAGSKPQAELVALADRLPEVTLTGFVEDLTPLRRRAGVFVAPVVAGAGVKFKVIDAMLARVPVVATTRAQEGIGSAEMYVAVTDDAHEFARATLSALTSPERAARIADSAAAWAHKKYGPETFAASVAAIYGTR